MTKRLVVAVVLALCFAEQTHGGQNARLMTTSAAVPALHSLCEISTSTGEPLVCVGTPGVHNVQVGLLHHGYWLYSVEYRTDAQFHIVRWNPADGQRTDVSVLGLWAAYTFCSDPTTGLAYCIGSPDGFVVNLYTFDPESGSYSIAVGSAYGWQGPLHAMTVDANGDAWLIARGRDLYRFDLANGVALYEGLVVGLPAPGLAQAAVPALAADTPGNLWALAFFTTNDPRNGLYQVDTLTRTASQLSGLNARTLAFAPNVGAMSYCIAKTNSLGCAPTIGAHGYASVSASEGLDVWADNALNNTAGLLLFGASGRNALPWHGGTLCVRPPLVRAPVRWSGGDPSPAHDCSGRWSLDLNSFLASWQPYPAGTVLNAQWYGRDSGFAGPSAFQLSDALEITLKP